MHCARVAVLLAKWWCGEDKGLHALADVDDDHLSDLSEAGRHLRRKALRQMRTRDQLDRRQWNGLDARGPARP